MRIFTSLFLNLFLADGCLSLATEVLSLFAPLPWLSELRNLLAYLVIFLAALLYLCLGVDSRLPKRLLLPLIAFACLSPFICWFFPDLVDRHGFGLLASAGQLLLCLIPYRLFAGGGGPGLTLPKGVFVGPFFRLKNTLIFAGVSLLLACVLLPLGVLGAADALMARYTAGFMRLSPGGVHMVERLYRRGDQTVRLAGMIHVGETGYYEALAATLSKGSSIVLAEGVTDRGHLLHDRLDYGKVAGSLGLSTQQQRMQLRGRPIEAAELEEPRPGRADAKAGPDILRADVDVSSFRPETVEFLNAVGKKMNGGGAARELLAYNAWARGVLTPKRQETIMDDILYRRNRQLIGQLQKALRRYDTVVIPWGALHMPAIQEEVLNEGFVLQEQRDRVSIDFKKMFRFRVR